MVRLNACDLPKEQVTLGASLVSFCNSLGPILGTSVGQAIFANLFVKRLDLVPGIDAAAVVRAGATNIATESGTSDVIREAFSYALTRAFVWAVVSGGMAFICSLFMEFGNVKKEWKPKQRERINISEPEKGAS